MTDKQLDNNNLELDVPEDPEIPDGQLDEATGGWNTYRDYYGVYCKKCRNIFYAYDDEALKRIATNPCRWCGAPYTNMIIDPSLSPRNKPDRPLH